MARRTILVCDNCGKEVDEQHGAVMRITYSDARRGAKQADLCGDCAITCGPGTVCSASSCETTCGGGLTNCDGVCRDVTNDRTN